MLGQLLPDSPGVRVYLVFAVVVACVALTVWLLAPLLVPLIVSVALYTLLAPLVNRLGHWGMARTPAVLLALLLVLLAGLIMLALIAPQLFDQLAALQQRLPGVVDTVNGYFQRLTGWLHAHSQLPPVDGQFFEMFSSYSGNLGKDVLLGFSGRFVQLTVILLLVPLFTYFLLVDYRALRNQLMSFVSNARFELAWLIYYRVSRQLQQYVRGVLLQSVLMASMTALGFGLIGLDMWLLLGALTGLLNLIPYVGPLMAMVLAAFVAIAQGGMDPSLLLAAIGVIVGAQLIDNVLVVPAVIAEAANLHPLSVIVGVIVFGNLFGFVGMVLAVPMLASARIVLSELYYGLRPPELQALR